MMNEKVDLHIHTTASDGRWTPQEVVSRAVQRGLHAIAITDHDTVDGYQIARSMVPPGLTIVSGIELSCDLPDHEVHILGYHFDVHHEELQCILEKILIDRLRRTEKIVARLDQLGYTILLERVREVAHSAKAIGRPHIAKVLVEKGYFSNISEVFTTVLAKNGAAYIPHYKLTPAEAISLIHRLGGLAVLAHPGLVGDDNLVQDMIGLGIDGLEAIHPAHSSKRICTYSAMAERCGLLITGGSDFHSIPGRYPEDLGEFAVPYEILEKLNYTKKIRMT